MWHVPLPQLGDGKLCDRGSVRPAGRLLLITVRRRRRGRRTG